MRSFLILCFVTVLCLSPIATPAMATDVIYFTSTPGSWIGQGQTLYLSPVTASRTFNLGAYTNTVTFSADGYHLRLVGPNHMLVDVGFYDQATRWPFNGASPGMWFSAPGRGDNKISGWFDVLQADYSTDGTIRAFAADFKQYDESSTTDWTQGSVRYHSDIPIPEPAPGAAILVSVAAMAMRRHSGRRRV
jgi:hypothetical protein